MWHRAATMRALALFIVMLLAACGSASPAPAPAPNVAATETRTSELSERATLTAPTAAPTITAVPTLTATPTGTKTRVSTSTPQPTPSPTPQGQSVQFGACRMTAPVGFIEERAGGGYYPASDRTGFAALDWPEASTLDSAIQIVRADLRKLFSDFSETALDRQPNSARLSFTGSATNRPGQGAAQIVVAGATGCAATLYLVSGSPIPFDSSFRTMVSTLQAVDPPPARPTPTPAPTSTPIPLPTPTIAPTSVPTATLTAAPSPATSGVTSEGDFRQRLRAKYSQLGDYRLTFETIRITTLSSGSVHVSFEVAFDDVNFLLNRALRTDLRAWGEALLLDLRVQYPDRMVFGNLEWVYYSDNLRDSSDCTYVSSSYTSGSGWYVAAYFVKVLTYPGGSGDTVKVCRGK